MKESKSSSGGIGFFGLLQILFITLKLLKVIEWSWLWVLAPTWGGAILFIIVLIICFNLRGQFRK